MDTMPPPPLRPLAVRRTAAIGLLLLATLAGCAESPGTAPPLAASDATLMSAPLLPAALQLAPQCEPEIRAFVEIARFARSHGESWTLFSDAIDAMKAQVVTCVDDGQEAAAWTVPEDRPAPRRRRTPR
jgi:hypothetical protein